MNTIVDLIKHRRSCRSYSDEPISRERLTELINQAVWVPNGSNNQPWRFVVITDKALMKKYSDYAKSEWLSNLKDTPHMHQYEQFMKDPNYNIFYGAPALIVIYGDTESYWRVYDCSMVASNLHLLAEEAGLGACWIGFAHNVFSVDKIKAELGVPGEYELVAPVIIGFPDSDCTGASVPRKPFVTHFYEGGQ